MPAAFKGIDYVVIEKVYLDGHGRNAAQSDSPTATGEHMRPVPMPVVGRKSAGLRRFAGEQPKPAALKECGIY